MDSLELTGLLLEASHRNIKLNNRVTKMKQSTFIRTSKTQAYFGTMITLMGSQGPMCMQDSLASMRFWMIRQRTNPSHRPAYLRNMGTIWLNYTSQLQIRPLTQTEHYFIQISHFQLITHPGFPSSLGIQSLLMVRFGLKWFCRKRGTEWYFWMPANADISTYISFT